ncbi:hypothetical protein [Streptomyces thermodiastaticus]|uniref:hypothetical protein n=1 Tax=Streptomyces thermodiastaticus TaxID=44061 RepID=UPI0019A16981|nr:hypothetical protein [Streptomyces thermodiastaticus]GHF90074.1 hypothetical protein GCM10018787_43510 [Streptomyces thermodiastaticus]
MSTEARHAPLPPHPPRVPSSATGPAAVPQPPAGNRPGQQPGRSPGPGASPAAADRAEDPPPAAGSAGRGASASSASATGPAGESAPASRTDGRAAGEDRATHERPRFPGARHTPGPATPPPPPASARFPDAPPTVGRHPSAPAPAPAARPGGSADGAGAESDTETTTRLRPVSARRPAGPGDSRTPHPAPPPSGAARAWNAPSAPGAARPVVSLGLPEGYDARGRGRALAAGTGARTAAAAVCLVLGIGLIGGAVTGSWLTDDSGSARTGTFATARTLWHSVPVDTLFPPTVQGPGAGPGGADRTWTRVAVAPDSDCADAFDPLLRRALAPVGCTRLLRATYTDATQTYVTTVGLLFTKADAATMKSLATRFGTEDLARRADLMPRPYAAPGTVAASFGDRQRASWTVSVPTDLPVVVYAVSGWADGRVVDTPQPAAEATRAGATSAPAQAGLGDEAQGLAGRIEKALRTTVTTATEKHS